MFRMLYEKTNTREYVNCLNAEEWKWKTSRAYYEK